MKYYRKGITLIELVLTIALMGVVLQVVYSILFVGNTSYSISTNKGFAQQDVRIVGDFVKSELKHITQMSVSDNYVDEYYSLRIKDEDGKKLLIKSKHVYTGDGTEENKETATTTTVISSIPINLESLTITNDILGEIDLLISQEEGKGVQKSRYELPLKIETINNSRMLENVNLDLVDGGVLYYRNNSSDLLTRGVDIDSNDADNKEGPYSIYFYTSDNKETIYNTVAGYKYENKPMPITPTRAGFDFIYWYDENGISYTGNTITIQAKNLDLFAKWKEKDTESKLDGLSIVSVKDKNGTVTKSDGVYSVKENKDVTIIVSYNYNKSTSNLELVLTGFTGSISEKENKATITVVAPSRNVTKDIKIEIREKSDNSKSISTSITLKGHNWF